MQAVFIILKQTDLVDDIMDALAQVGIKGGTAIDSEGMAASLERTNKNVAMVQLLRGILSGEESHKSKTVFVIVKDEQVDAVKDAVVSVTGDLSKPNAGIMFGVPISFTEGIS
ncbi:MAG: hypothetical protein LUE12_04615 [Ruminococcus sp.]|nr:hypothetical protein [Ruminococcus sp.]